MNPVESPHALLISRVAPERWHVLEDDLVVGRGETSRRPDGRLFVSIDAWHDAAFDRLAEVMPAALPRPLHTVVDEADLDLTARWRRAGFTTRRREWEYALPTGPDSPAVTPGAADLGAASLGAASPAASRGAASLGAAGPAASPEDPGSAEPPPGVTIKACGTAEQAALQALDRTIRDEVGPGWPDMPAEVLARPVLDPAHYAVAAAHGEYVGLLRVTMVTRLPRIGLIAVRTDHRRRGIARALLAHTLGALHAVGKKTASAEITESNVAATALFEGFGARRTGSTLELVMR
ncbi:GNAT family N-acetyltransferase [Paractinoplanes globisporus]|uniref:GNAT family N-acetyltransferase n=1 Tax=Paractinoplanes globisporus TaxID=113565 RepID=A0ABW6W8U5_9ACTN|nr:GNAT family N-acetyltransferase [Actinoplanes globisporus]